MGKTKRFVDKKSSARFQLVHRSQRDPLAADSDAPQLVLRPINVPEHLADKFEGAMAPQLPSNARVVPIGARVAPDARNVVGHDDEDDDDDDEDGDDSDLDTIEGDDEEDEDDENPFSDAEDEDATASDSAAAGAAAAGTAAKGTKATSAKDAQNASAKPRRTAVGAFEDADESPEVQAKLQTSQFARKEQLAQFGVYFGDNYDYMKHLKTIGNSGDGVFVAADSKKMIAGLPADLFASADETKVGLMNLQAAPATAIGLDWDPEIVAALDASDDETDMGPELEDDFISMANATDGVDVEGDADLDRELGLNSDSEDDTTTGQFERPGMTDAKAEMLARFGLSAGKRLPAGRSDDEDDDDDSNFGSEAEDRLADLDDGRFDLDSEATSKSRRRGPSDNKSRMSNFSMTSSVMRRNDGLQLLDERFDHVLDAAYADDEIGALDEEGEFIAGSGDVGHFSSLLDEFLEERELALRYSKEDEGEIKMRRKTARPAITKSRSNFDAVPPPLPEPSAASTEDVFDVSDDESSDDDRAPIMERLYVPPKPRDLLDALSVSSNQFNHPTLIKEPIIRLSKKTGLPIGVLSTRGAGKMDDERGVLTTKSLSRHDQRQAQQDAEDDEDDDVSVAESTVSTIRDKNETPEERRIRKQAVKAQRKERRVVKKATKDAFKVEELRQQHLSTSRKAANQGIKIQ
ncbi:hypothetical protein CAOG_05508 [Capsaspora owczarzaki ATCC 30864]|nr:hypothetical protein CAOG_05508 [Capsaspora owczarzaki ATCC 30864]|eukprot:XP_004346181.2 hypothetical protein CAOG_05508 [Capsaspora owczarzaki ATCC 30864]